MLKIYHKELLYMAKPVEDLRIYQAEVGSALRLVGDRWPWAQVDLRGAQYTDAVDGSRRLSGVLGGLATAYSEGREGEVHDLTNDRLWGYFIISVFWDFKTQAYAQ
jgi:hypothetical protein